MTAPAPLWTPGPEAKALVAEFARKFVTEQSEGEWPDEMIHQDAAKLTNGFMALLPSLARGGGE